MSNTDSTHTVRTRRIVTAGILLLVGVIFAALPVLDGVRFDGRSLLACFLIVTAGFIYPTRKN